MLEQVVKPLSSGSILPWLTASRIVTTNSLSQLATPSSISSDQSLTLSGTATATVAGLITAQSGLTVSSNAAVSGTGTVTGLLTASSALTVASTVTLTLQTASRILTTSSTSTVASPSAISTAQTLTLSATTGTTLTVSSTDSSVVQTSNSIYTAGGIGVAKAISINGDGSGVCLYLSAGNSLFRSTSANAADTGYIDYPRLTFRDPSDGFSTGLTLHNNVLTVTKATGATLIVDSTDAASVTLAGGILLNGATTKTIKYTNGVANAAVAVTFGAVGPTGSTAGNQVGWLRVNIGGTDRYIPYW